jgi:alpha-1,6-mannosyltransferase
MMGIGALGAGALPVPNPLFGLRVISLPARNATAAIAITYAGMGMLVLAWLWIGRMLRARGAVAPAPDRTQLARTGLLWALPLALAPPMFSKDVYSYLAQSAITARGLDPYSLGPAAALGVDDPLTRTIPTIWRDTPAPYGPLFLTLGRGITALTGSDVVQGVFAHRVLALCGVALIIWALPRLGRRCDLDAGLVLWLGAANPLVLFHLVSGVHNEGLMIGLMLAGVELSLRALDRGSGFLRDPRFVLGAVVVALGAAVKLPALLALGFVGMAAARRRGARVRDVAVVAAVLTAVAVAVFVVLGLGTGLGFGWTRTLGTANVIRSWMSLATDLGQLSGQIGILSGLGDHTDTVLTITRGLGGLVAALLCLRLLLLVLRGRLDPVTGLGVGLGAVVLLGPVVHPWYLLWAAIPLAATRGMPRHRRAALAASALLAVMLPPTGADFAFRSFQLPLAILAGIVILVVALLIVRRELRAAGPAEVTSMADADAEPARLGDDLGHAPLDDPADIPESEIVAPPSPTAPRTPT